MRPTRHASTLRAANEEEYNERMMVKVWRDITVSVVRKCEGEGLEGLVSDDFGPIYLAMVRLPEPCSANLGMK